MKCICRVSCNAKTKKGRDHYTAFRVGLGYRPVPECGHASHVSEFPLQTMEIQSMQLMEFWTQFN